MNDTSSDEEGPRAEPLSREKRKVVFGKVFASGKARSATFFTKSAEPSPSTDKVNQESVPDYQRPLVRSRSEDVGPRVREEWAQELWGTPALRDSVVALRTSVQDYEREASSHEWTELIKVNADIRELTKLADHERLKRPSAHGKDESADGLTKFSTVALEYSKMLDVVMNQSPEYAGLAWGAIRMLLVAHTNHSKLKYSVEHHLIHFGQEFGVVNQLMNAHPTAKMVEAVSEAYSAFSKFLAKAVKYYKESKLMSALKAFGFPWETRFQMLVSRIEAAFKRIKEIASAGHFGMTVQSQHMLRSLGAGQEQLRMDMKQDSIDLRQQLKLELKDEVQALFQSFDQNWIARFEAIMSNAQAALPAPQTQSTQKLPAPSTVAAIEYASSMTQEKPMNAHSPQATFLADHVLKPKRLRRFRDKCFPLLQELDNDDAQLNMRLKHVTNNDLQQIVGLFQNESVRNWLQTISSTFLWVNTFRGSGRADWATAFATRIIEYSSKIDNMTVVYHMCGNHSSSHNVSTPKILLQSLILQILQLHHKAFSRKAFPFTLEHFSDAHDDLEELWSLFIDCCHEANAPCIWLIIDHIDNLDKDADYNALITNLESLSHDQSRIFKIFVSSRAGRAPNFIEEAAEDSAREVSETPVPRRVSIVTIPRRNSRHSAALLSKQKRFSRIPDSAPTPAPSQATKADIEKLLDSSEDDLLNTDKEENDIVASPTSIKSPRASRKKRNEATSESDQDSISESLSDSSLEFTREDPFASSEESDWEKSTSTTTAPKDVGAGKKSIAKKKIVASDEDDEDDDLFSFTRNTKENKHDDKVHPDLMSTDEDTDDLNEMPKKIPNPPSRKAAHGKSTKGPLDSEESDSM
ncbi:MAG: hypothetical protein Q9227_007981 [Pyrenula ochraceoflavens]